MAVTVKSLYICPRCSEGISSPELQTTCPVCGLVLGSKPGQKPYQPPLTLHEQHLKFENAQLHLQSVLSLNINKAEAMLQDALNIIETIAVKKSKISDIRVLIEIGIQIGEIAKSYDAFLHAKGQHVPAILLGLAEEAAEKNPTIIQTQDKKQNEQSSDTTSGGSG